MPVAEINGFHLYHETLGEGPPVLYVHGGMGGPRSVLRKPWGEDSAIPGYQFVFFDRRGTGRSEVPADGYDLTTFAKDALALLDHLRIEKTSILGTSAGGPIALQIALLAPARVQALILANSSAHLWPEGTQDAQLVLGLVRLLETDGLQAAFEARPAHARHSLEPIWRWPEAEAHGWLDRSQREERELAEQAAQLPMDEQLRRHTAELRICRGYIGVDLTPMVGEIRCPVLLIHGDADTIIPFSGSENLRAALPQAELFAIPGAGHMILNRPEAMGAAARFLARVHKG